MDATIPSSQSPSLHFLSSRFQRRPLEASQGRSTCVAKLVAWRSALVRTGPVFGPFLPGTSAGESCPSRAGREKVSPAMLVYRSRKTTGRATDGTTASGGADQRTAARNPTARRAATGSEACRATTATCRIRSSLPLLLPPLVL